MSLITPTLFVAMICLGLVAITLVLRLLIPLTKRFLAFSHGVDSMQERVFPLLAFVTLTCILIKLTAF